VDQPSGAVFENKWLADAIGKDYHAMSETVSSLADYDGYFEAAELAAASKFQEFLVL
jgi:hypothetical protein